MDGSPSFTPVYSRMQTRLNSYLEKLGDLIGDSAIPDHRTFELKTLMRGQVTYVTRERSDALQITALRYFYETPPFEALEGR